MCEALVVSQCAPTLAGIKTGSLFSCPAEEEETLRGSLLRLNRLLVPRGARLLPVRRMRGRILLYMYRPARLAADLAVQEAREILDRLGYPMGSAEERAAELIRRIRAGGEFPHEAGLFLGYPPGDVDGFMRLGGRRAKLRGTWCVYGDTASARRIFSAYRRCRTLYEDAYRRHNSVEKLIVSTQSINMKERRTQA